MSISVRCAASAFRPRFRLLSALLWAAWRGGLRLSSPASESVSSPAHRRVSDVAAPGVVGSVCALWFASLAPPIQRTHTHRTVHTRLQSSAPAPAADPTAAGRRSRCPLSLSPGLVDSRIARCPRDRSASRASAAASRARHSTPLIRPHARPTHPTDAPVTLARVRRARHCQRP